MILEIDINSNAEEFVNSWSKSYSYNLESLYNKNINCSLDNYDCFLKMFRWKNGIYNVSKKKMETINRFWNSREVLLSLKKKFNWDDFEKEFQPNKTSAIWKIFMLHLINPFDFPIFDMHVYRFHQFLSTGEIIEIKENQSFKYNYYKETYLPWFLDIRDKNNLDPKKMDECFFKLGQVIKQLKGAPIKLVVK
jgi:hypothetical protein